MAPTDSPSLFDAGLGAERALSVSQLNKAAREILETEFSDVWVTGEISRFLAHSSGHWYFTLKDDQASISGAMFRGSNRLCRVKPADGMQVVVRGKVSIYEQRGAYQIVVDHLEPAGVGALLAALEKLKARLEAEGLFDQARKRRLPLLPRRIGIATSPTGAALQDMLRVLEARGARLHVVIAPCRVQGQGAAAEIAGALQRLDGLGDLDAVIVGRGGGSIEDLWAFNEEIVARAIHAMRVPVISAIGHEIDFTLADLVADVRAATPSQAAEMVSASALEVRDHVVLLQRRLAQSARGSCVLMRSRLARLEPERVAMRLRGRVERLSQHVDVIDQRLLRAMTQDVRRRRVELDGLARRVSPEGLLGAVRQRRAALDQGGRMLATAMRTRLASQRDRIDALARALSALSPLGVLERGYAVIQHGDGRVVRASDEVSVGERLRARLARGRIDVTVNGQA